jgi:hypothetical protein
LKDADRCVRGREVPIDRQRALTLRDCELRAIERSNDRLVNQMRQSVFRSQRQRSSGGDLRCRKTRRPVVGEEIVCDYGVLRNRPRINQFRNLMDIGSRLCLLVASVTLVAGSAFAQAPKTPTPAAPLDSTTPSPNHSAPAAPAQSLSKKLNQSNGVIHPKEVDPAIEKPPPKVGDPNVVPPPGTSGGAPAPEAK